MDATKVKQFVGLHLFEFAYLCVLAVLPFIVAKPVVGLTILSILFLIGFASLFKKLTFRKVPLEGKSVIITGCDSGFGLALAQRLSSHGVMVFAGCLNTKSDGAEKLKSLGSHLIKVIPLDVTNDQSVSEAVGFVREHSNYKGLWGLVNNAGIGPVVDVEFCSMEKYRSVVEVNLLGTIRVTKSFLPLVRKQQGRIINVTSADLCYPGHSAHALTKSGITAFSNSLRLEMRKFGIKVITVEPGNFYGATGFLNKSALAVMEKEADTIYKEAEKEVQEAYDRDYLHRVHSSAVGFSSTSCNTLAPVVDALEEAVVSTRPSVNYLVDGAKLLDIHNWLLRLKPVLPQSVIDTYMERDMCV